jgi:GNAT superfamily N-acetyltransferase
MPYILRAALPEDEDILTQMLYLAIYTPPGSPPPDPAAIRRPELQRYVRGWGRPGDLGFLAVDGDRGDVTGAAWLRLFPDDEPGYGYAGPGIPELTIAVRPFARGAGLGTRLLVHLIAAARRQFQALSLSVAEPNPARRLYERFGFSTLSHQGGTLTMLLDLEGEISPVMPEPLTEDVYLGNAGEDGKDFGGWLVGDIPTWLAREDHSPQATGKLRPVWHYGPRGSSQVEVKWGRHRPGERRPTGWTVPADKTTLSVLVQGEFILRFRDPGDPDFWVELRLQKEGDYVIWRESVPHTWEALQDSLVLTVRWKEGR